MSNSHLKMKGVLFDVDGTLLDTWRIIELSFHHAMVEALGHDCSMQVFADRIGEPLAVQMRDYAENDAQLQAILESYRAYNKTILESELREFDGMRQTLDALAHDGWKLGVVTSKSHDSAVRNLDVVDYNTYFDCLVGCDDVDRPKPDGQPIEVGARLLGLDPGECFYVGDSPFDLMAGNAAGAATVAVHWGQHAIEKLRDFNPDIECATTQDLPGVLAGYSAR